MIRNILLEIDLMGLIILNLRPEFFNKSYKNFNVQSEMRFHGYKE